MEGNPHLETFKHHEKEILKQAQVKTQAQKRPKNILSLHIRLILRTEIACSNWKTN